MPIAPAFLDELRARTDLGALVGRAVKLQRAGRDLRGCCPFHQEKSASFYVYPDHYHCFGCGVHGDAIRWLTEKQGLAFRDAVNELAAAAGMSVPEDSPQAREKAERAATLRDVTEAAATWLAERLWAAEGAGARAYLTRRGVTPETARAFGIGFAPDARGTLTAALQPAMGAERLVEAGLSILPEEGGPAFDRFRNRLMFPIRDARGRTVGFGGRALGDFKPKYLNSPDTPLFDKGRLLWNLDRAAAPARNAGRLLVVEGYMDAVALAGVGIAETVAPMGTALSEAQLALAWRIVPEPTLCFDGDRAGLAAAGKAARRALPGLAPGRSLRFVTLPEGQDPDDVVRSGGRAAFDALAATPEPLHALLWRTAQAEADTSSPEGRAGLKAELAAITKEIADRDVREQYEILFRLQFMESFGWKRQPGQWEAPAAPAPPRRRVRPLENEGHSVLAGMLAWPDVASDHWEALSALQLLDPRLLRVRGALADAVLHDPDIHSPALVLRLIDQGLSADVAWVLDRYPLHYSFTNSASAPDRARDMLARKVEALAAAALDATQAAALLRESREAFADAGDAPVLQARRETLFQRTRARGVARGQVRDAMYAFAQDMGPDPDMRVRPRPAQAGENDIGEEQYGVGGTGGSESDRERRAADRS